MAKIKINTHLEIGMESRMDPSILRNEVTTQLCRLDRIPFHLLCKFPCTHQWRIQEFPRGGQFFPENCMKLKEFGPGRGLTAANTYLSSYCSSLAFSFPELFPRLGEVVNLTSQSFPLMLHHVTLTRDLDVQLVHHVTKQRAEVRSEKMLNLKHSWSFLVLQPSDIEWPVSFIFNWCKLL